MGSITVTNLGKAYKVYPGRFARLKEWLLPFSKPQHTIKWVLQGINFTVRPGEAVGIIGVNGAGKSTLLKMLTGTTQPTTGTIETTGRVAALLELGIGFHPEFTGRQNAYMAGQLLGMGMEEIQELMPQIEEFTEIGEYMDHPVRVYSSGMQMRLAFAVATAKRPDILIVDEALSVGDAYFQHKSFERIRQFRKEGTTLLLVSHDKQAIQSICDRALLLNDGKLAVEGKPDAVMDYYNALLARHQKQNIKQLPGRHGKLETTSGTGEAKILDVSLLDEEGAHVDVIGVNQKLCLQVTTISCEKIEQLVLGYSIKDRLGQVMYGTNTAHTNQFLYNIERDEKHAFRINFVSTLGPGTYSVQIALVGSHTHLDKNYEWKDIALIFHVVNDTEYHFEGCAWMRPAIEIVKI
ncbi:MAG: ABC transporter ATP-binding protein [Candidatus Zixiibacteriota bacterium]